LLEGGDALGGNLYFIVASFYDEDLLFLPSFTVAHGDGGTRVADAVFASNSLRDVEVPEGNVVEGGGEGVRTDRAEVADVEVADAVASFPPCCEEMTHGYDWDVGAVG